MAIYDPTTFEDPARLTDPGTPPDLQVDPAPTPPTPTPPTDTRTGIASAYQQFLGRAPQAYEYDFWSGNQNYRAGIQGSPEAKAYSYSGQVGGYTPQHQALPGFDQAKLNDARLGTTHKYTVARILQGGGTIQQAAQAVGGTVVNGDKIRYPDGFIADVYFDYGGPNQRVQYTQVGGPGWQGAGDGTTERAQAAARAGQTGGAGGAHGMPSAQGSAFSDPATSQWEQLVRAMVDRLNQPIPQHTLELQQTQALDPMERQRQQMRQQAALRLSQRGIRPGSGIFEESMRDIDREFNALGTRTRAGFANTAAQQTEDRSLAGVNLFGQIPQYQDRRLQLAQQALMPANPMQALSLQQNQQELASRNQRYNNEQNQMFWQWLAQVAAQAVNGRKR